MHPPSLVRQIASATLLVFGLAACNGSSSNIFSPPTSAPNPIPSGQARVRFVNGSPDAGTISITIDGSVAYTAGYASLSAYQTFTAASHTVAVMQGSSTLISQPMTFASAGKYSLVLAGEQHPNYTPGPGITNTPTLGTLNLQLFGDPIYGTGGTAATVTFRHASPWMTISTQPIQVGYVSPPNSSGGTAFTTLNFGQVSTAISLPQAVIGQPIAFYSMNSGSGIRLNPSQADPADAQNVLPFNNDINLTMYMVDSGGATSSPSAGVSTALSAALIGVFDPNG